MVTITLPQELEQAITERAQQQGISPELWTIGTLRQWLFADAAIEPASEPDSLEGWMLDFSTDNGGVLHSSESVAGGAQMSQDTGCKFAEGLLNKRQEGKL